MNPVAISLPESLRPLFWDVDFDSLSWGTDHNFIVRRILQTGDWEAVRWLRRVWGDQEVRRWIVAHYGGRLTPRQLRYWEVVLELPAEDIERWVAAAKNNPWEMRVQR